MMRTDAAVLAVKLMEQHGLDPFLWSFKFDQAVRRFGYCRHYRGGGGVISLSELFTELNPEEEVRITILHEIAHALVGPGVGHGPKWQAKCRELGIEPERCFGGPGSKRSVVQPPSRFVGRCAVGHEFFRERIREKYRDKMSCSVCHPVWSSDHLIVWEENRVNNR